MEHLLQEYVDDRISESDRGEVERYLATRPELADRIASYCQQNALFDEIHDSFQPEDDGGAIHELQKQLKKSLRRQRRDFRAVRYAAAVAVFIAVGASGLWLSDHTNEFEVTQSTLPPVPYSPFGGGVIRSPAEALVSEGEESIAWLAKQLTGHSLKVPRLEDHGLQLVGGTVLDSAQVPAVRLVYTDKEVRPHFLYVGLSSDVGDHAFPFLPEGYISINWRRQGLLFALTGPMESPELLTVMHSVSDSVSTLPEAGKPVESVKMGPSSGGTSSATRNEGPIQPVGLPNQAASEPESGDKPVNSAETPNPADPVKAPEEVAATEDEPKPL